MKVQGRRLIFNMDMVILAPPLVSDLYSSGAQHVAIICDQWPHIASTLPIALWETRNIKHACSLESIFSN